MCPGYSEKETELVPLGEGGPASAGGDCFGLLDLIQLLYPSFETRGSMAVVSNDIIIHN